MLFTLGLDILQIRKKVSHMLSLIIIAKIKIDLYDSLPLENALTLHNVIIHIKSVVNHYRYNIFLETFSHQLLKNNHNK